MQEGALTHLYYYIIGPILHKHGSRTIADVWN